MTEKAQICTFDTADISENDIRYRYPEVLEALLRDHTTQKNIFWGTDNYSELGEGYRYHDPIMPEKITGKFGKVIMPRVKKDRDLQQARVRDMAGLSEEEINFIETAIKPME